MIVTMFPQPEEQAKAFAVAPVPANDAPIGVEQAHAQKPITPDTPTSAGNPEAAGHEAGQDAHAAADTAIAGSRRR
jgi:hypothetical protein